jgi:hypothetical protein
MCNGTIFEVAAFSHLSVHVPYADMMGAWEYIQLRKQSERVYAIRF